MSWWIYLNNDDNTPVVVDSHSEGGIYQLGGCSHPELNVTYNYGPHYYRELDKDAGFKWLHGKTGAEAQARLEKAVAALGTNRVPDYWADTPGNAGYALSILLKWARQHPQARFRVS